MIRRARALLSTLIITVLLCQRALAESADIVFADFENETYGQWTATGTAFGPGPAAGTLPNQMPVSGFKGKRLVNSYYKGDASTGTLTSPAFRIERKFINFLIGGGGFEAKTCINLLIDGKIVRTATGENTKPGGRELLIQESWDVTDLVGRNAQIQIVDDATGGWGHILVDHIAFSDVKAATLQSNVSLNLVADRQYLNFPVRNGAPVRNAKVIIDGKPVREFPIECADGDAPDWWAALDVSDYRGKTLTVLVDKLPEDSKFLAAVDQTDVPKDAKSLYKEPLRPQFHFSTARGWSNDPNGLVFFAGQYHLFFQLNPYGTQSANMHWGHAASKDLVHWRQLPIALYPDELGPMWSGSAAVDWKNTSGLGTDGAAPLVLIYTAAGKFVQCIASSTDGNTFTKYAKNPVVKNITNGNRDPKVFWHEPTKRWVMALYVALPADAKPGQRERHTIHFLTSADLKEWTVASHIDGFFECPDLFPLPVDGDPNRTKWVLTAASSEYMVGRFDGARFTPDTGKLKGHLGRGFYAAQTFSDIPAADGRRIMIGWFQTPAPGMSFNQSMTVPLELRLLGTPDGPRLAFSPVKELQLLRAESRTHGPVQLKPADPPITDAGGELLDVRIQCKPDKDSQIILTVRGVTIRYNAIDQQLAVGDHKVRSPLRDGRQNLTVLADRNSFEIFASDGLTYVPWPNIPKAADKSVSLSVQGAPASIDSFDVHTLKSAWDDAR
jgi:fructan beta-fructosidase